jgi:hypothetical protein
MADEEIITPPATEVESSEPVEPSTEVTETVTEAPETAKPEERYAPEPEKQPETVPLHVHKETRDKLKTEIRELREQLAKTQPSKAKLSEIASKWGVEPETISDLAEAIKSESTREIEAKFGRLEDEQKQAKIDAAFEKEFKDKVLKNYPQLESKKEQIKALAFTKQYINTPVDQIAQQVFGDLLGKGSMEEARPATEKDGEVVDFSKPMTDEQRAKVMADPEARKSYFSYLDSHPLG